MKEEDSDKDNLLSYIDTQISKYISKLTKSTPQQEVVDMPIEYEPGSWKLYIEYMYDYTDSNLSKNDLEDICRNHGLPTEGVKADLVQRLKIHSARVLASP
ncbi:5686_t:CDS:2, partial [Scutellospora calospora]